MSVEVKTPRKLIEVALPLDLINTAAAREKNIRHGHPSTLHLWWARRPLAAARAVIFAQMVNDPSWRWELDHPGELPPNNLKATWAKSRKRLFDIIEKLVTWENSNKEEVLERARAEIRKSWLETCEINRGHPDASEMFDPAKLPGLHDPFAGGGAIPLEAQRLGLEAFASDLNPVSVLINKAMIELPPIFSGNPPVTPSSNSQNALISREWRGGEGLAEDVRYYGKWLREQAQKRIGNLYPDIEVDDHVISERPDLLPLLGQKLTVVAWIWARTVKSPNPAFRHVDVPLVSNFILSPMEGKEAYVQPVVHGDTYRFKVNASTPPASAKNGTTAGKRAAFICLLSETPIDYAYIREEGKAGRLGQKLMAIVAEGPRGRIYLSPDFGFESIALSAEPDWHPDVKISHWPGRTNVVEYGMTNFGDLFTKRQLVALNTFSVLVGEAYEKVKADALAAGMSISGGSLEGEGAGAEAYADAVAIYLSFLVSKLADKGSTLCTWDCGPTSNKTATGRSARVATVRVTFGRQALPMSWDFAEVNFFSDSVGSMDTVLNTLTAPLERFITKTSRGHAKVADAQNQNISRYKVISTDPPYYDNISYADLSDFFYIWLRRSLKEILPGLFSTIAVSKSEELVASPYRHGNKAAAEQFFLDGMTKAMGNISHQAHPAFPVTIYYAFKQSETEDKFGTTSTGWETFLEAVLSSGFALTGTWPMRTEMGSRMIGSGANALASSIVLVCRRRAADAPRTSRRAFIRELNAALPEALDEMTRGSGEDSSPIAPVDLSQAIIGPGMAIFSKYSAVLEADGSPMAVGSALRLINRFLAGEDSDPDTQFCLQWFEQHGWGWGSFGDADQLARAKGTAVNGVQQAGVIEAVGGQVRLLRWSDYTADWDPTSDSRLPVWEVLHQLIRLFKSQGEIGAGGVLSAVSGKADAARQLAYRLYTLCERKGWSEDARAYNEIITSWAAIDDAATRVPNPRQANLFDA